jgi:hypothetical protein
MRARPFVKVPSEDRRRGALHAPGLLSQSRIIETLLQASTANGAEPETADSIVDIFLIVLIDVKMYFFWK